MSEVLYSISQQTEDISRTLSDVPIRLFLGFQQDVIHKGTSVQVPVWSQCNVIVHFFMSTRELYEQVPVWFWQPGTKQNLHRTMTQCLDDHVVMFPGSPKDTFLFAV